MTAAPTAVRRGPRYWLHGYRAMLRFDLVSFRDWLLPFLLIQVLMGAGMAIIYGFYLGEMPRAAATFVATGAPTLSLIPLGMALVPSLVAIRKLDDTYDYMWSLPVPRMMTVLSSFTLFTVITIPGFVLTLLIAGWRYDVDLSVSAAIVPALLLTALMSSSVGFGIGHAVAEPRMTNLITNLVIFTVLMFSPIAFPIENFPGWLAAAHRVLPFWHMANVIRDGLTDGLVADPARSYLVVAAWTVGAWLVTAWTVGRRR